MVEPSRRRVRVAILALAAAGLADLAATLAAGPFERASPAPAWSVVVSGYALPPFDGEVVHWSEVEVRLSIANGM